MIDCSNKFGFKKAITYGNYMLLLYNHGFYLFVSKEDFNAHWEIITTSCRARVKALYSVDINL